MIFKNLFRRKGRTILTVLGISIGVAAIIALGAAAQGMRAGLTSMTRGSEADLMLTQKDTLSVLMSSIDVAVADELRAWPEVADVDGVLTGNAVLDGSSYLFLFGHDPEGFSIAHYRIVEGLALAEARRVRGKPLLVGRRAAQSLEVGVGDALSLGGSVFRVVGMYETGDGFEDAAVVIPLEEAQAISLQPHRVSLLYIKLRVPSSGDSTADVDRLRARVERRFPDLGLSSTSGYVEQEQMLAILDGMAMGVAGLAVVIGGIVMTNTLFMSVFERTHEIGILRSLGWKRRQVLFLLLGESLALALFGGALGIGLGIAATFAVSHSSSVLGVFGSHFSPGLFARALVTTAVLGMVGGAYPAWWASRLLPLEALRYEGGSEARALRILPGGLTPLRLVVSNLWRRRTSTALTLLGIGVSIAAVVALGGLTEGMTQIMTRMWRASQTDLFAIQKGVDADFSAIDERVGARIVARPDVQAVSGLIWTALNTPEVPMVMVFGYHPQSYAVRRFRIVEGQPLITRHQVIVGRQAADQMGVEPGDTLRLLQSSFRVVGIYETGVSYEEAGLVIGLREAQALTGKSRQVMYYEIKLHDPRQAEEVRDQLNAAFPGVDFTLVADAVESMSDFAVMEQMVGQISFLAVLVGGVGMLNTMLMSVLERTREIGVLRALGWKRRQVLAMILRESLVLGAVGGLSGIGIGIGMSRLVGLAPGIYGAMEPIFTPQLFVQAIVVALVTGALGGLYPAWRATRMRPVEALRYE